MQKVAFMSIDGLDPTVFLVSIITLSLLVGVLVGRALWGPGQQDIKSRTSTGDPNRSESSASTAGEDTAGLPSTPDSPSIPELATEIEEMTGRLVARWKN